MKTVLVACVLSMTACVSQNGPVQPDGDETPTHAITWSQGRSDSPGVPGPVVCTTEISHPCPFLLYTTTFVVDTDTSTITWGDPTGGVGDNGFTAEQRGPVTEPVTVDLATGDVTLVMHGDDGGLRHTAIITHTSNEGYEGDITWTLDTIAGNTTFHLQVN